MPQTPRVKPTFTWFLVAFGLFVLFNIFDLSSTIVGLKLGLSETNAALLFLSERMNVSVGGVLVLVKSLLFVGGGAILLIGSKTQNSGSRKIMFLSIWGFALLFALVAISNLLTIYTALAV